MQINKKENLVRVIIDNKLCFTYHRICDKTSQKLNTSARLYSFMKLEKQRLIMKTFVNSQFGCCPLIFMSYNRTLNNRINMIHERALGIVCRDKNQVNPSYCKKTIQ